MIHSMDVSSENCSLILVFVCLVLWSVFASSVDEIFSIPFGSFKFIQNDVQWIPNRKKKLYDV